MAAKKNKYYRVLLLGTGLNETLLVAGHEVVAMPASTYHKFTFPDGRILWKNDFGVASVLVFPLDLTAEDYDLLENTPNP